MALRIICVLLCITKTWVWCFPNPQGTAQVSLTAPNGAFIHGGLPRPSFTASAGSAGSSATVGGGNVGVNGGATPNNLGVRPPIMTNIGARPQMGGGGNYQGGSGNFPVPFHSNLLGSGFGLGSSTVNAKTQSASHIMDGVSYGIGRVPAYVGYGVQSAGRLEKAGEQLFKAAVDLGTGGLSNGMQGLAMGMNMMNGLGNAGMVGLGKVANGSAQILEHILSLSVTESGLFNALVALGRLLSPAQGSFLSSGLNMSSLINAANYLGIPNSNVNLNSLLEAASRLQASLSNAGINANSISSAANTASVNIDAIRQAASAAANNLGLSTAWNILSSRLSGAAAPSLQAAVNSNSQLPVSAVSAFGSPQSGVSVSSPGFNAQLGSDSNAATPGARLNVDVPDSGSSWLSWMG